VARMLTSLSSYALLMAEWDYRKNAISPETLSHGSHTRVWWRCENGHSWECAVKNRTSEKHQRSCPICKSLWFLRPDLIVEFDQEKNGELNPQHVTANSHKKVHWLCSDCGHSYLATVYNRNSGNSGCPACSGSVVTAKNRLSVHSAELVSEWGKKNKRPPTEFSYGSDHRAYWECSTCAHEWRASINKRTISGRGCPACSGRVVSDKNRLSIQRPNLLSEIHPTKNKDFDPSKVSYGTNLKIWWKCEMGHEWQAVITNRARGAGCPHCKPHTSRAELRLYAELEGLFDEVRNREKIDKIELDIFLPALKLGIEYDGAFWHKGKSNADNTKNQKMKEKGVTLIRMREKPLQKIDDLDVLVDPNDLKLDNIKQLVKNILGLSNNSEKPLKLKKYLTATTFIAENRYRELVSSLPGPEPQKSLQHLNPELSKSWDVDLNAPLTPMMFTPFSDKRVQWICQDDKTHRWEARIATRSQGYGCPFCAGKRTNKEDSFGKKYPKLLSEFDSEKNGDLSPFQFRVGSTQKVWWICSLCNHNWRSTIGSRTKGHGCPKCGKKSAAKKMGKPIYCPELGLNFESAPHAVTELTKMGYKPHRSDINSVCRGEKKSHLGLTFVYLND